MDVIAAFLLCSHCHCHTLDAVLYNHPRGGREGGGRGGGRGEGEGARGVH